MISTQIRMCQKVFQVVVPNLLIIRLSIPQFNPSRNRMVLVRAANILLISRGLAVSVISEFKYCTFLEVVVKQLISASVEAVDRKHKLGLAIIVIITRIN